MPASAGARQVEADWRTETFVRRRAPCTGTRDAAICAVLLLLHAAGCGAQAMPPSWRTAPGARLPLADGLAPDCHEATASWLQHIVAAVGHTAQDRAAAWQLLQSGVLLPHSARNASSSAAATRHRRTISLPRDPTEDAQSVRIAPIGATALASQHGSIPTHQPAGTKSLHVRVLERARQPHGSGALAKDNKRVHAPAAQDRGGDHNDGPALRAALVPVEGTEAQWLRATGWPSDRLADPCAGESWRGVSCSSSGRVDSIDLRGRGDLPPYSLGATVANLTELGIM